jgi:hypothetical protein
MAFDERAINREVKRIDDAIHLRGMERGSRMGESALGGAAIEGILGSMSMDRPELALQTAGSLTAAGAKAANQALLQNALRTEEEQQSWDRLGPMRKAEAREKKKIRRRERKARERAAGFRTGHDVARTIGKLSFLAVPGGAAIGEIGSQLHGLIAGAAIDKKLASQLKRTQSSRDRLADKVADYKLPGLGKYQSAFQRAIGTGFEGRVAPTYGAQQARRPRRLSTGEEEQSVFDMFSGEFGEASV